MKNNDFNKKLGDMLNSEKITLPDELSKENIENLLNEKGGILNPKRPVTHIGKRIVKIMASAAAVIILLVGVLAVADVSMMKIHEKKKDEILNAVIEEKVEASDYSDIETLVLNYYKKIVGNRYNNYESLADKFSGAVNDMANGMGLEESFDTPSSDSITLNNTNSNSSQTDDLHSSTNVQVNGVDEADIIKNDGRYIYYLNNSTLTITDCADGKNIKVVSTLDFSEGYASEMYLYNDKLIVLSNKETSIKNEAEEKSMGTCDCIAYAMYFDTVITVYDVSDKANPKAEYTQTIDGDYVTSRVIGGKLLTVSNYSIPYGYVRGDDFDEACNAVKGLSVPCYSINGGETMKIPADRIKCFDEEQPTQYTVTAVIDIENPDAEPKINAYLGGGYEVYCTADEMFIASAKYSYWTKDDGEVIVSDDNGQGFSVVTHIYQLDITDDGVIYKKDVKIGGTCLNQFSMDKYGDYFRIVTTGMKNNHGEYSSRDNMLYILDKDMNIVGFLDWIAIGEDIKSARFMGNTLYLVTFYQTDPLFIIDLTDPTKPEIKGELKIPGFSSYLHPIGDNLVIGVGEGGTMSGTDGSAKVSLFDVSDPCNPKEIDNYTVANAYFDSNHKAFMTVDADSFALCLTGYSYNTGNYNENYKIMMFDVSENGLTVHGEYSGYLWESGSPYYYSVLRGAFIGDTIFAVNGFGIKAYSMTTNELLGEAEF